MMKGERPLLLWGPNIPAGGIARSAIFLGTLGQAADHNLS
jgi:hypothetical protein